MFKEKYRTRQVTFIAGEEKYETLYKESGLLFKVNVGTAYFSPRLSTERLRIRSSGLRWRAYFQHVCWNWYILADNCEDEGLRSRECGHQSRGDQIGTGVVETQQEDEGKSTGWFLTTQKILPLNIKGEFDRILMPLPERSSEFLPPP